MYQQKPYECFLCSKSLVADTLQEPGWLFQYVIVVSGLGCLPTIMPEASIKVAYFSAGNLEENRSNEHNRFSEKSKEMDCK